MSDLSREPELTIHIDNTDHSVNYSNFPLLIFKITEMLAIFFNLKEQILYKNIKIKV